MTVPYSEVAERNLLGSALLWRDAAELVAAEVEPEDFYLPAHVAIARTIRQLVNAGARVTAEAIEHELAHVDGDNDRRHGYLVSLMAKAAPSSARRDAEEIWDRAARRRVQMGAAQLQLAAADLTVPFEDIAASARDLAGLADIPVASALQSPDARDFLAEPDEHEDWLIPGLLERGDRLIVTGEEGRGKARGSDRWPSARPQGSGPSELAA